MLSTVESEGQTCSAILSSSKFPASNKLQRQSFVIALLKLFFSVHVLNRCFQQYAINYIVDVRLLLIALSLTMAICTICASFCADIVTVGIIQPSERRKPLKRHSTIGRWRQINWFGVQRVKNVYKLGANWILSKKINGFSVHSIRFCFGKRSAASIKKLQNCVCILIIDGSSFTLIHVFNYYQRRFHHGYICFFVWKTNSSWWLVNNKLITSMCQRRPKNI